MRKLEGEVIDANDEALIQGWDIEKALRKLESSLLEKALKNYFALHYTDKNIL